MIKWNLKKPKHAKLLQNITAKNVCLFPCVYCVFLTSSLVYDRLFQRKFVQGNLSRCPINFLDKFLLHTANHNNFR
uniref:Uncharacterized protein n=1 Tax=Meloidogyne enterolobii TaxID=390850 RepID=A0A6V7V8W8_MELEN|nr:unnamed protein product [Meloidogyne enterolobii]